MCLYHQIVVIKSLGDHQDIVNVICCKSVINREEDVI